MRVYREERPLEWPPDAVARRLFGDSQRRHRTTTRVAGLYRTDVRIDSESGTTVTTVHVPGVLALVALAVVVGAGGLVRPALRLAALWLCVLAIVVPLGHLLPGLDERPTIGTVTDRRISPHTAPAYVAGIVLLWVTLRPALGATAGVLCGCVLAVGAGSYAVATGWRIASVSTLWLAVAGLLPLVSTATNLALTATLLAGKTPVVLVLAASTVTASLSVVFVFAYCWLAYLNVRDARFGSLASAPVRVALLGVYTLVVAGLCLAGLRLAWDVSSTFGYSFLVVPCLPLAVPLGGWLYSAVETAAVRWRLLWNADRRTVDGIPVYVLDRDGPYVRAVSFPRGVVLDRTVIEALPSDELTAVLAHERYHLRARNRVLRAIATVASIPVGRNALLAFMDYPTRERAADRYAAATAGRGALVRALRRLEGLGSPRSRTRSPIAAPYALLYGAGPDTASYPSVDDRVAAVSG